MLCRDTQKPLNRFGSSSPPSRLSDVCILFAEAPPASLSYFCSARTRMGGCWAERRAAAPEIVDTFPVLQQMHIRVSQPALQAGEG